MWCECAPPPAGWSQTPGEMLRQSQILEERPDRPYSSDKFVNIQVNLIRKLISVESLDVIQPHPHGWRPK